MAQNGDKRRDPRVPLVLRVEYPGIDAMRDVTENLSAGGLFIRTTRELPVGVRLPLQIGFPGLLPPLEVEVEVVRRTSSADETPGVAVKVPVDRVDDRHKLARLVETARGPVAPRTRRSFRILVVEDNPHVVEMYEYALRKLGSQGDNVSITVEYAGNGHDALARLAAPPRVDLVMADLYMPVMDGFGLIERMRATPALAAIPILVISAGAADAKARALDLGVDFYLQKPVKFADVIATVGTLLRIG
jgi:uncharacterized protein (TIGR02266 family)